MTIYLVCQRSRWESWIWFSHLGTVVLGVPSARRERYPLGIAHPGKLSLLSCVTVQSWESIIKDTTGNFPTSSTPWLTHARSFLCNSLSPAKVSDWPNCLSSQECAHRSRPFADPYLTSFLSLTLVSAEASTWSKLSCLFFGNCLSKAQKTLDPPNVPAAVPPHGCPHPASQHGPQEVAASPTAGLSGTPRSPWKNPNP